MPFSGYHPIRRQQIDESELVKIWVIAAFILVSALISIYSLEPGIKDMFPSLASFSPHLYYIPILLMAIWYPHKKLHFCALIVAVFLSSVAIFSFRGMEIDFISSGFNAAIYLWVVAATSMTTKEPAMVPDSDELIDILNSDKYRTPKGMIARLKENSNSAIFGWPGDEIESLVQSLDADQNEVRDHARHMLSTIGQPAIQPLIKSLRADERRVREAAAQALAGIGKPAAPDLLVALRDDDWHVRMGACISLRIIGAREAVPDFIELLHDTNIYVRGEAAKSLGRIGNEQVVTPLCDALDDPSESVRLRAANALGRLRHPDGVPALTHVLLEDVHPRVRSRAAQALADIGTQEALVALQKGVREAREPEVRMMTRAALRRLEGEERTWE